LSQLATPAAGLQSAFVQQAVAAETEEQRRKLSGALRMVFKVIFILWLAMAAGVFFFRGPISSTYKITNQAALWVTLVLALVSLFMPGVLGLMQGRQNFLWLGLASICNGFGRLAGVWVMVVFFGGYAAGAMTGALFGSLVAIGIGFWQTRDVWRVRPAPFEWKPWLRIIPLTLAPAAMTFLFTQDMITVREVFRENTGFYAAAGTIGRALVFLVGPMTAVMFPKIVASAVRAEKTSVLAQALGATAVIAVGSALFLTLFPEWPVRIVQGEKYLAAARLIPWFAWCMVPLTLANVLINNLLARERFQVVWWLTGIALAYYITLKWLGRSGALLQREQMAAFKLVIQIMGAFGVVLLGLSWFFSWRAGRPGRFAPPATVR
jgi:O-antigen/teichoic acid export membrane protein